MTPCLSRDADDSAVFFGILFSKVDADIGQWKIGYKRQGGRFRVFCRCQPQKTTMRHNVKTVEATKLVKDFGMTTLKSKLAERYRRTQSKYLAKEKGKGMFMKIILQCTLMENVWADHSPFLSSMRSASNHGMKRCPRQLQPNSSAKSRWQKQRLRTPQKSQESRSKMPILLLFRWRGIAQGSADCVDQDINANAHYLFLSHCHKCKLIPSPLSFSFYSSMYFAIFLHWDWHWQNFLTAVSCFSVYPNSTPELRAIMAGNMLTLARRNLTPFIPGI